MRQVPYLWAIILNPSWIFFNPTIYLKENFPVASWTYGRAVASLQTDGGCPSEMAHVTRQSPGPSSELSGWPNGSRPATSQLTVILPPPTDNHFISISLFQATEELMAGEFMMTYCFTWGINQFFSFLCSDSPLCVQFYFIILFVHIQHMLRLLKSTNYTEFNLHIYGASIPRVLGRQSAHWFVPSFLCYCLARELADCPLLLLADLANGLQEWFQQFRSRWLQPELCRVPGKSLRSLNGKG